MLERKKGFPEHFYSRLETRLAAIFSFLKSSLVVDVLLVRRTKIFDSLGLALQCIEMVQYFKRTQVISWKPISFFSSVKFCAIPVDSWLYFKTSPCSYSFCDLNYRIKLFHFDSLYRLFRRLRSHTQCHYFLCCSRFPFLFVKIWSFMRIVTQTSFLYK